jgi:hypothetical protein
MSSQPGGRVKSEVDALDSNPPKAMTKSLEAIRTLEVLKARTSALIPIKNFNQFRRAARTFLYVRFGRQKRRRRGDERRLLVVLTGG